MKFIPYVLKTLRRHRARSLLTVTGSAVALFVYCFVAAVGGGLDELEDRAEGQQTLIAFQANKFCPATSHLPQDYDQQILKMTGVREVVPIQVFTNNCRASLDVVVFYGLPPNQLQRARSFRLLAGDWSQFQQQQDAAVMGQAVASRRGVNIGDRFTIGELSVEVVAIFAAEDRAEENYIYTHLDFLQRRQSQDRVGTVTQHEILLAEGADPLAVARQVDDTFRNGPVATDTRPKSAFQAKSLGDLTQVIEMTGYLGYACLGLILCLVATTTLMSVQDRVGEHAVLQTLGFSPPQVFRMVVSESLILSLMGGAVGVGLAMVALQTSHLAIGAEAVTIAVGPSLKLASSGLALAGMSGILAGLPPAWHAARAEIVPALRQM